jgi:hypothetical protein
MSFWVERWNGGTVTDAAQSSRLNQFLRRSIRAFSRVFAAMGVHIVPTRLGAIEAAPNQLGTIWNVKTRE